MNKLNQEMEYNNRYYSVPKQVVCDNFDLLCGPKSEYGIINPELRTSFISVLTNGKTKSVGTISNWFRPEKDTWQSKLRIPAEILLKAAKVVRQDPTIFFSEDHAWFYKNRESILNCVAEYMEEAGRPIETEPKEIMDKLKMALNHLGLKYADVQEKINEKNLACKSYMAGVNRKVKVGSAQTSMFQIVSEGAGMDFEEEFTAIDGSKIKFTKDNQAGFGRKAIEFLANHSRDKVTKEDLYDVIEKNDQKYNKAKTDLDDLNIVDKREIAAAAGGKYECFFVCQDGKVY